ncbi:UDP-N-acetylgalactosamine-undecaprenyl-phosphate N-acetylgalactosaminephosphotransferase [Caprobacter fermentans]|uniref:Sugar transferase n=1 Tax=Caproicibacter fermentans TaxID=2576756 RepID=A0A6N8I396_9FIRM|nr:sugar transferase [Caproicibacter fermentans]MVB12419.1 UDP-N-acetylgalactosamine-undecaprenyl-phosphate N-acetylgalactosaminephosphotransferase [Caproicibacter fermentans]OCN01938.1 glycosyl transferase [Clostridium sp. W14A]QNK40517.1 sugar transferase [Caproicibacter fermentans]
MTLKALPPNMKNEFTQEYWNQLQRKRFTLFLKRTGDILASLFILLIFSPVLLLLAIAVKLDSPGPVFYRQVRVGRYNRDFRIYKFRTMVQNADKIGPAVTTGEDARITRIGKLIRKCRLDEFSQLINVLNGTMSLVGPRPEVRRYVDAYSPEGMATLLVRPGITAPSSIAFKDEDRLLVASGDPDRIYIEQILPPKTELNLEYIRKVSVWGDIKIMVQTVAAVI